MKFSGYIGGIVGLMKDAMRFIAFWLKHPLYVAVFLAIIIGIFYVNGIPPHRISIFLSDKWQSFVENRKQTFKEDYRLFSKHFTDKKKNVSEQSEKKRIQSSEKQNQQQMTEEVFGWQKAFQEAQKKIKISDGDVFSGVLSVIGADKVRVNDKTFSLNVRLRSGKAAEAYHQLKRRFDGREAKCVPDKASPEKAECFIGALGVSEMLIDFGYADPI